MECPITAMLDNWECSFLNCLATLTTSYRMPQFQEPLQLINQLYYELVSTSNWSIFKSILQSYSIIWNSMRSIGLITTLHKMVFQLLNQNVVQFNI